MFAPNSKPFFHHRSDNFHQLLFLAEKAFKRLAGLDQDWEVLFLTGSGSLALESVFYSATRPVTVLFDTEKGTEFARRLFHQAFLYGRVGLGTEDVAYVQYETAKSVLNISGWKAKGITIVDAVSAFPYYMPPEDADILVTVSGKQLEAPPGVAIVAIHKRVWESSFFNKRDERLSYLNLARYSSYRGMRETPNTPAITVLYDLWQALEQFDRERLIQRVNSRYAAIVEVCGEEPTMSPPVYTFKGPLHIQNLWGLYGKERTQLFLWDSTPDANENFEDLLNELRRRKNEGLDSAVRWA